MSEAIIGIFSAIVLIVKFIKSILVKYVGFTVILSAQFTITSASIIFMIGFYAFTITALIEIYNMGINIFDYASTTNNSSVSCLLGYLDCLGFTPAAQNGFTMAYGVLSTVVIFHLLKFTYSAMRIIGNELFKLGILLGQALS